jgi:hypothetical protein
MKPKFVTGDHVVWCQLFGTSLERLPNGIVVSVLPSNTVPDAMVRGLKPDAFGWVYYVLFSDSLKLKGPLPSSELHGLT